MDTYTFVFIETQVVDGSDAQVQRGSVVLVPGPTQGIIGLYTNVLRASLSRYWSEISGGRVEVQSEGEVSIKVPFRQADWNAMKSKPNGNGQRIDAALAQARNQAGLADNVVPIVLSNVSDEKRAGQFNSNAGIILNAARVCHSAVAHEIGQFFQYQGSRTGGRADVLRSFYREEYADRTHGSSPCGTESLTKVFRGSSCGQSNHR
jgi:hypothetical protein